MIHISYTLITYWIHNNEKMAFWCIWHLIFLYQYECKYIQQTLIIFYELNNMFVPMRKIFWWPFNIGQLFYLYNRFNICIEDGKYQAQKWIENYIYHASLYLLYESLMYLKLSYLLHIEYFLLVKFTRNLFSI